MSSCVFPCTVEAGYNPTLLPDISFPNSCILPIKEVCYSVWLLLLSMVVTTRIICMVVTTHIICMVVTTHIICMVVTTHIICMVVITHIICRLVPRPHTPNSREEKESGVTSQNPWAVSRSLEWTIKSQSGVYWHNVEVRTSTSFCMSQSIL